MLLPWLFYSHGSEMRVEVEISMRAKLYVRRKDENGGVAPSCGVFVPPLTAPGAGPRPRMFQAPRRLQSTRVGWNSRRSSRLIAARSGGANISQWTADRDRDRGDIGPGDCVRRCFEDRTAVSVLDDIVRMCWARLHRNNFLEDVWLEEELVEVRGRPAPLATATVWLGI